MNYAESIGAKYYEINIKKAMNGEINNIFWTMWKNECR